MTDTERQGLQNLQDTQDSVTTAAAKARAALESGDYTSMDYWTNKATADRELYEKQLSDYYDSTKELRRRQLELMAPGAKEQDLGRQLTNVRGQIDQFNIQTEEDKFNEYQGQTLGFAGGRAAEIDIRAEFKRQRMAATEKNLLLSLGLEQDARKMEGETIDKQLEYLGSDFELQSKVQEKIAASEEKVFERADTLRKESKDALVSILNSLEGIDPADITPDMQKQIDDIAARAGIPSDLVKAALKTQHDKQVFDESMKRASEARLAKTVPATIVAGLSPEQQADPFIKLLLSTAGGKPITDTFAQSLNKGLNVLGQIGGLQANIKDTNTGPLTGLFRGANPWDTNAQTIKAQLNAIVPNLARGVYGEVGVLTDNDIKQYSKTLPTLTSTEDIRNAVLGITVDLIGKSIKRTLEINAANQKDVSGFVDIYTEMQSTRDSIFSQIPGYKGTGAKSLESLGVTKEDETAFDSITSESPASTSGGNFFLDVWKGLTGQ